MMLDFLLVVSLALQMLTGWTQRTPAKQPFTHRPPPQAPILLLSLLDTNGDGILDAAEMSNAPAVLRALDRNGDGKLTPDELWPDRLPAGNLRGLNRLAGVWAPPSQP